MTEKLRIVPFRAAHLGAIQPQPAQAFVAPYLGAAAGRALEGPGLAFTGIAGGTVVGAAGLVPVWPGRAIAWAVLSAMPPALFLATTRAVDRFLADQRIGRIEAYVKSDFAAGHRWARLLGFAREGGPLRRFDPDGHDYDIYARLGPPRRDQATSSL